jgi:formylglycine-generating enzyme required for sulfatase activity
MISMNALDILFWVLLLTLAAIIYAVEAGLAARHRTLVISTMFSVVASSTYMMLVRDHGSHAAGTPEEFRGGGERRDNPNKNSKQQGKGGAAVNDGGAGSGADPKLSDDGAPPVKGEFADCAGCPSMIGVPAGRFRMGSEATEPGHQDTEGPVSINIPKAFAIGRFEVTRAEYAMFAAEMNPAPSPCLHGGRVVKGLAWNKSAFEQSGRHPVACVSFYDARAFVNWLSQKTGKIYRLPSESEWEYAARGGTRTAYNEGDTIGSDKANFGRGRDGTIPVGFFGANAFGLADVHGNVSEIVGDCWTPNLGFVPLDGQPVTTAGNCSERVVKGGGWSSTPERTRSASRSVVEEGMATTGMGFRVARGFDQEDRKAGAAAVK